MLSRWIPLVHIFHRRPQQWARMSPMQKHYLRRGDITVVHWMGPMGIAYYFKNDGVLIRAIFFFANWEIDFL